MTRILFLDHEETDYVAAQIYSALCLRLGSKNVTDFCATGCKLSYHGQVHRYPSIYATDPGAKGTERWEGGTAPLGETSPLPWLRAQPMIEWTYEALEVAVHGGAFDAVILASPRATNVKTLDRLIASVGRSSLPQLTIVDGEDYDAIRWDLIERFRPEAYFKRELVQEPLDLYPAQRQAMAGSVRILPLPLTPTEMRSRQETDRFTIDVAMPGGGNVPGGIAQYESAVSKITSKTYFGYGTYENYLSTLASARIVVAPKGHSQDSLRSWEALAVEGPLVCIHRHTLIRPYPFVDGVHAVHFDGPEDLESILKMYLADEVSRASIAAAGHAHFLRYHAPASRARYILRELGLEV